MFYTRFLLNGLSVYFSFNFQNSKKETRGLMISSVFTLYITHMVTGMPKRDRDLSAPHFF